MTWTARGNEWVNIRAAADKASALLGAIPNGGKVQGIKEGDWIKVELAAGGVAVHESLDGLPYKYGYMLGALMMPYAIDPPPPPVTVTTAKHQLGVHVIGYSRGAVEMANAGCKFITIIDDEMVAAQIAQAHPDCTVLFRRWIGSNKFNGDELANRVGGIRLPNVINLGYCEADSWGYGTLQELRTRIDNDLRFADLMLADGKNVGVGSFSMGCPDYTQQWVIDQMKRYAPYYNRPMITGKPNVYMDLHLYSPLANRIAPAIAKAMIDDPGVLHRGPVGNIKFYGDTLSACVVKPNENSIASWEGPVQELAIAKSPYNPNPAPTEMDIWFELRWMWLFTRCGFDPSLCKIIASETGLDEGGIGGFPAHGTTDEQFHNWCAAWLETMNRPIVINGKPYPSPFKGATLFQHGKGMNVNWLGYDVARWVAQPRMRWN